MEMLLVLAILVVLMGLVAPRILGTQKKADISTAKTQIGGLKQSLQQYAMEMKTYPSTEEGLLALIEAPTDSDQSGKWQGPYIENTEIPKDPWGNDYQYEFPSTHNEENTDSPDLWSLGPDGEDGTEDDIVNWTREEDAAK